MRKASFVLVLVFSASFLWSQQTTGKISGQVKATDGSGLAGANVQIDGTAMGAATDAEGSYTILNVPAGIGTISQSGTNPLCPYGRIHRNQNDNSSYFFASDRG